MSNKGDSIEATGGGEREPYLPWINEAKRLVAYFESLCGPGNGLVAAESCCKEIIQAVNDYHIHTELFWDKVLEEIQKF